MLDVLLIAFSTTLTAIASLVQQCECIVRWHALRIDQYKVLIVVHESPALALGPLSTGFTAGLFWIQLYLYNVDALLVFFW